MLHLVLAFAIGAPAFPTPAPRPTPFVLTVPRVIGPDGLRGGSATPPPVHRREGEEESIYGEESREGLAARLRRAAEWERLAKAWTADRRTRTVPLRVRPL